jgi:hypothetical protein
MFTISQLIDTVEQIRRMERRLPALRAAVKEGADPGRLHSTEANIDQLKTVLPAVYPFPEAILRAAEHRIEHDDLVAQLLDVEKKIAAAAEVAKSQAWKYSVRKEGPKESPEVVALKELHANIDAKIEAVDACAAPLMRILAEEERACAEAAQTREWAARGFADPVPACILREREGRIRDLEREGLHSLKMGRGHCIVVC